MGQSTSMPGFKTIWWMEHFTRSGADGGEISWMEITQ